MLCSPFSPCICCKDSPQAFMHPDVWLECELMLKHVNHVKELHKRGERDVCLAFHFL